MNIRDIEDPREPQERAESAARCWERAEALRARSAERLQRHEDRRTFLEDATFRHEMRRSMALAAALERERARREEEESWRERELMDDLRREVESMIGDGWTAAELADVGIGSALLARLGITLDPDEEPG